MVLKWKDKKSGSKQKPKVCVDYNDAIGGDDIYDQYFVTYSTKKKKTEDLLPLVTFDSFQLICNTQETWWHIKTLTVPYEIIQ